MQPQQGSDGAEWLQALRAVDRHRVIAQVQSRQRVVLGGLFLGLFLFIATLLANQGTHTTSARGAPALCSPSGRASVVVITQIIHMTDTTRACDESLPSIRCCREMHSDVAGRSIYCDPILDGHNIPGRS